MRIRWVFFALVLSAITVTWVVSNYNYVSEVGEEDFEQSNQLARERALKFLRGKPVLESYRNFTWDDYFTETDLARETGKKLDYDWFERHSSEVVTDDDGSYIVTWIGLPGCEKSREEDGAWEVGPPWFDSEGRRCYLLWYVEVHLDKELDPVRVAISEAGGIE